MTTPLGPFVEPIGYIKNDINDEGVVMANMTKKGRLDCIFIRNQSNGTVLVEVNVVKDSEEKELLRQQFKPFESGDMLIGSVMNMEPEDTWFVRTQRPTDFVTCMFNYSIFNET